VEASNIITIIISAVLAATGVYTAHSNNKKVRAEASQALANAESSEAQAVHSYAEAATKMVEVASGLQLRLDDTNKRLDVLAALIV
jgi:hypothetical protein